MTVEKILEMYRNQEISKSRAEAMLKEISIINETPLVSLNEIVVIPKNTQINS